MRPVRVMRTRPLNWRSITPTCTGMDEGVGVRHTSNLIEKLPKAGSYMDL